MSFDEVFYDGEPQPRSAFLARATRVHTIKALEDPGQMIGGDSAAGVADSHDSVLARTLRGDTDTTSGGGVAPRGVEQGREGLSRRLRTASFRPLDWFGPYLANFGTHG